MTKIQKIIFPLLLLFSLVFNFIATQKLVYFYNIFEKEKIVTEVVDGDTFQLASGKRVRLMGVNAPEYERCGGKEAKLELEKLISGQKVELGEEVTEAYGRSLALVYLKGKLINQIILEKGWGRTDYRKNSQREVLTAAFHLAQQDKLGIFSDLCRDEKITPPDANCLIKANIDKNSYEKFYHLPSCSHYNQIIIEKDIGERYFCSEKEARDAGFKKAAGCP